VRHILDAGQKNSTFTPKQRVRFQAKVLSNGSNPALRSPASIRSYSAVSPWTRATLTFLVFKVLLAAHCYARIYV